MSNTNSAPHVSHPSSAADDQREFSRYPCHPETRCEIVVDREISFQALRIENISAAGVTLILDRILPIGTTVGIELHDHTGQFSYQRQMRIVYLFKEPSGDILLGGALTRTLSEQELKSLV